VPAQLAIGAWAAGTAIGATGAPYSPYCGGCWGWGTVWWKLLEKFCCCYAMATRIKRTATL